MKQTIYKTVEIQIPNKSNTSDFEWCLKNGLIVQYSDDY